MEICITLHQILGTLDFSLQSSGGRRCKNDRLQYKVLGAIIKISYCVKPIKQHTHSYVYMYIHIYMKPKTFLTLVFKEYAPIMAMYFSPQL